MTFRKLLFAAAFLAAAAQTIRADDKGPEADPTDFLREFLREQPRFRVSGIMTSRQPGKPPVECGARLRFDRDVGAVFAYNTTGAAPEPYDFYFWNKSLALFVYDRERTTIVKSELLGAPFRPAFNFIWDVLRESDKGAGLKTLLFSGLMRMDMIPRPGGAEIVFTKRFGPISVDKISFVFDENYHLRSMLLEESNGTTHTFKAVSYEKMTKKLARPKVRKKSSPEW